MTQPTVRPVCHGIESPSGAQNQTFITVGQFVDIGRALWRGARSVVYNCRWPSSAHLFSGTITVIYSHIFETLPTWRARSPYIYSPEREWPSYNPRQWVPVSSPPTNGKNLGGCNVIIDGPDLWCMLLRWLHTNCKFHEDRYSRWSNIKDFPRQFEWL
jgi:hypothetical protein